MRVRSNRVVLVSLLALVITGLLAWGHGPRQAEQAASPTAAPGAAGALANGQPGVRVHPLVIPPDMTAEWALDSSVLVFLSPKAVQDDAWRGAHTVHVPRESATIQGAIDQSPEGGHVVVAPGTYRETLDYRGRQVVVRSEAGPEVTTIDAEERATAVVFRSGEQRGAALVGFRITHGQSALTETNAGLKHPPSGGIFVGPGASPIIIGNIIEDNRGHDGGGILCERGSSPLVANNLIQRNRGVKGGGIRMSGSRAVVVNNVIRDNLAERLGGGVYWRDGSTPRIVNNTIFANVSEDMGGGVFCAAGAPASLSVVLANNVIHGNRAPRGPAMAINAIEDIPTRVRMVSNLVDGGRAGVYLAHPNAAVIYEDSNTELAADAPFDPFNPGPGFVGRATGDPAWVLAVPVDFRGRPRVRRSAQGSTTVDVGAVQVNE